MSNLGGQITSKYSSLEIDHFSNRKLQVDINGEPKLGSVLKFVKNNKLKFYYHSKGCFCCSYPNWTPKQEGNPYANRNMYGGFKCNIVRREYS